MFYHGYDNYMKHAFPEDEIRPVTCQPLTRDRDNPAHIELNDVMGNYSLTLIDNLSTLAILASSPTKVRGKTKGLMHFKAGVRAVVDQYGDGTDGRYGTGKRGKGFDLDSKVQVFETVIRGVGGLLSAHLFAVGELPILGYKPRVREKTDASSGIPVWSIKWSPTFTYDGQLLRLAHDLAKRLLPAFYTPTGLPYPRVNLRHGVPFYLNSPLNQNAEIGQCPVSSEAPAELTETCSAGAGSLVLEFTVLSRLTGDQRFEQLAKRAFWSVWDRKSAIGLVGSGIDAETGQWTTPYTGIGAGIDSFYEYAAKAGILLSSADMPIGLKKYSSDHPIEFNSQLVSDERQSAEAFEKVWQDSHAAIKRHLYRGHQHTHPHYIQGDLYTGAARAFWLDSLSAFYPGLLTLGGEVEEAIASHMLLTALWTRFSALPERWSVHGGGVEGGLGWWGGRPEFVESTYHLYRATRDPWYLHVGEMVLRDIKRRCWAKCGWSGTQDVRTGDRNDRMESFFLGETMKYLFLLFDLDHVLNKLDSAFVFSTEGHPLIIPRSGHTHRVVQSSSANSKQCPLKLSSIPLSHSAIMVRKDYFHAAKLARLHLMPRPDTIESPLVEFSRDHPSITLSDVTSPSNYTYYPWTLPPDLIPPDAVCSPITNRPTFDITFPPAPNTIIGPGILSRVNSGIMINSMGGLRLGMIQDAPDSGGSNNEHFRVQAINNVALGKDERVFLPKDTASSIVNPLDPNFTRVRDPVMLDVVVDLETPNNTVTAIGTSEDESVKPEPLQQAFSALINQVASLISGQPEPAVDQKDTTRDFVPAILPMGPGAAPLPNFEEAQGPHVHGASKHPLLWSSIYISDHNCNGRLPLEIPRDSQIIVVRRGICSFNRKLQNIPSFSPSAKSLQLVIVVSFDEEQDDGVPPGWLIRPFLEAVQTTSSGLTRHNPIPLVMVAGGQQTYDLLRRAVGIGIRRRYTIQAQGIPISNLIIL